MEKCFVINAKKQQKEPDARSAAYAERHRMSLTYKTYYYLS